MIINGRHCRVNFYFNQIFLLVLADDEALLLAGTAGSDVRELISFASFDIPNETNPQNQTTDVCLRRLMSISLIIF